MSRRYLILITNLVLALVLVGLTHASFKQGRLLDDNDPIKVTSAKGDVVEPDSDIQAMMDQVLTGTVRQYTGDLSGEWPVLIAGQPYTIQSRYTLSGEPIEKAAQYVGDHLADLGLAVEYHPWLYDPGTSPAIDGENISGEIKGQTFSETIYIISAHLDSRPHDYLAAPGADDNASGSAAVLIAADILSQYQWDCTMRFVFFTGEEQGLLGSWDYAREAFENEERIAGVLNLDMIAWNASGTAPDMEIHARSTVTGSLELAQLYAGVIDTYNLDLIPEIIPDGTTRSDHAIFWVYKYPAVLGTEDFTDNATGTYPGDFNPYYHTSNDVLDHLDIDYFTDQVKAAVGTFALMGNCKQSNYFPMVSIGE